MPISLGDDVIIHYAMKLNGGQVIETTFGKDPLFFRVGSGDLPQGLEEALIGLNKGDKKAITLPPSKSFGQKRKNVTTEVPRSMFEEEEKLTKNALVELISKEGVRHMVSVHEVKENSVILDLNHPLAGQTLTVDIEVVEIFPKDA